MNYVRSKNAQKTISADVLNFVSKIGALRRLSLTNFEGDGDHILYIERWVTVLEWSQNEYRNVKMRRLVIQYIYIYIYIYIYRYCSLAYKAMLSCPN